MRLTRFAIPFVALCATLAPLHAQWLNYPTHGLPRTADGKVDLNAPAPKTADGKPDLSGVWTTPDGKYLRNISEDLGDLPFQPWARALYKQRQDVEGKGRPSERCLPHGITDFDALPYPRRFVQTPDMIYMMFEAYNHFRQIYMDGRALPENPQPAWFGYSVGKWDKDALVVDTIGFNETTWLDDGGHPHSESMHVTERFHRVNLGRMDLALTVDDPKAYTKPWTVNMRLNLMPDTDIMEFICENERDLPHLVGK